MSRRHRPIIITETFALDFERVASAMRFLMAYGAAYEDHTAAPQDYAENDNRHTTREVLADEDRSETDEDLPRIKEGSKRTQ